MKLDDDDFGPLLLHVVDDFLAGVHTATIEGNDHLRELTFTLIEEGPRELAASLASVAQLTAETIRLLNGGNLPAGQVGIVWGVPGHPEVSEDDLSDEARHGLIATRLVVAAANEDEPMLFDQAIALSAEPTGVHILIAELELLASLTRMPGGQAAWTTVRQEQ